MAGSLTGRLSNLDPGISPNSSGLPGLDLLKEMVGATITGAIIACVGAVAIGAGMWGFGKLASHGRSADIGQKAMLFGCGGALVAAAANALVAFFSAAGSRI